MKDNLPTIKPTKALAVMWLNLKSLVTGKAGEDFTKACNAHLMECVDCEHVTEGAFGVKLITQTKKVWRENAETKRLTKALEAAKIAVKNAEIDLKAAQEKAGYEEEPGLAYYKAV